MNRQWRGTGIKLCVHGISADTEATAGLEASVDETGAGDDVTVSDPADRLSSTPSL